MSHTYIATLGKRPEAITIALDKLLERFDITKIVLITSPPEAAPIADAYAAVTQEIRTFYDMPLYIEEVTQINGAPLVDIATPADAEAYYRNVVELLFRYKQDGQRLHLNVAGGRKAMSIYAMMAAALVMTPELDHVWTVLSSENLVQQTGQFHIPPGQREQVNVVPLPLVMPRLAPGIDPRNVQAQHTRRAIFLSKLTPSEYDVVETLRQHPYASNQDLADLLHKGRKTVENQLQTVYAKMVGFYDFGEAIPNKRQALIDIIRNT